MISLDLREASALGRVEASPVCQKPVGHSLKPASFHREAGFLVSGTKCHPIRSKGMAGTSTSRNGVMGDSGGLGDFLAGVDGLFRRFLQNTVFRASDLIRLRSRRNHRLQPQRQLRPLVG